MTDSDPALTTDGRPGADVDGAAPCSLVQAEVDAVCEAIGPHRLVWLTSPEREDLVAALVADGCAVEEVPAPGERPALDRAPVVVATGNSREVTSRLTGAVRAGAEEFVVSVAYRRPSLAAGWVDGPGPSELDDDLRAVGLVAVDVAWVVRPDASDALDGPDVVGAGPGVGAGDRICAVAHAVRRSASTAADRGAAHLADAQTRARAAEHEALALRAQVAELTHDLAEARAAARAGWDGLAAERAAREALEATRLFRMAAPLRRVWGSLRRG